jgi:hypothetical protein
VLSPLASVLKLASRILCLVVIVSFVLFVVNRTSDASQHQQQELSGETAGAGTEHEAGVAGDNGGGKDSLRRRIDEASEAITSPFSGVTSGASSEWLIRTVDLLLALAVYGFGLSYIARMIRMRL